MIWAPAHPALRELRGVRRWRRLANLDRFEVFYRVYVTGLFIAISIFFLSGQSENVNLGRRGVELTRDFGAPVVGLVVALVAAAGMRSGAGGGPLVIEGPEARLVLSAPIPRGPALRGPALRKLRSSLFIGVTAGAVVGVVAYRWLGRSAISWIASEALFGGLVAIVWTATAMLFSGLRWGRLAAWVGGGAVMGLSALELTGRTPLSPGGLVGHIAVWPIDFDPLGIIGVTIALTLTVAGLAMIGGVSIERAEGRARLVSGMRLAVSFFDVRVIVLTRRLLAHESIRPKPWFRLRQADPSRFPIWKRGWQGFLRWPIRRIMRVLVAGAACGGCLVGLWQGLTSMIVLAGGLLYLAALDLIEPLGQEMDHQTFQESFPIPTSRLHLHHIPTSVVAMLPVALVSQAVFLAFVPEAGAAPGLFLVLTSALSAVSGAAASIRMTEPPVLRAMQLPPEAMGMRILLSIAYPPLLATAGLLPILVARELAYDPNRLGIPGIAFTSMLVVSVLLGRLVILRFEEKIRMRLRKPLSH